MLGSVANHAWAEDSLYFRLSRGEVVCERESKHTTSGSFRIANLKNSAWNPIVKDENDGAEEENQAEVRTARSKNPKLSKALQALKELGPGPHPTTKVAEQSGLSRSACWNQLRRGEESGIVSRPSSGSWEWATL